MSTPTLEQIARETAEKMRQKLFARGGYRKQTKEWDNDEFSELILSALRSVAPQQATGEVERLMEERMALQAKLDEVLAEKRDVVELRRLLDDRNGLIHTLRSMLREAGFPDRVKWGEDLNGNEDWVQIRIDVQLRDALEKLRSAPFVGRNEDTERIDFIASYWDSQNVGPQRLLRGTRIDNPTGSFRAAIDQARKEGK